MLNFETAHPVDGSARAAISAARQDAISNQWFIRALMGQGYPEAALEGIGPHLPDGWQDDMKIIAAPLDWLGVNYYTRRLHDAAPGLWPNDRAQDGPPPRTQMGWEIRPEGLSEFLIRLARDHTGGLPLYVTENGMALKPGDDVTDDEPRVTFIADHLRAARSAMDHGVNLRGFFYWSLLDNYEWVCGFGPRFGLVYVDYQTMARSPKASWHAFQKMLHPAQAV